MYAAPEAGFERLMGEISVEISEVVESSCSPLDSTVTVSVTSPSCRLTFTDVTCATVARRSLITDCLRPVAVTLT